MDVRNFAGISIAFTLILAMVATGSPGSLVLLEIGLIALLYVLRHRRSAVSRAPGRSPLRRKIAAASQRRIRI